MNREQRRAADKLKRRAKKYQLPQAAKQLVTASARTHFLLGLVCLLRSPIESLKAIGLLAEMKDKQR